MSRSRIGSHRGLSPLAAVVAAAAARQGISHTDADLQAAVTELAIMARVSVLEAGVLATDDVRASVDAVASRHLGRAVANREFTRSCRRIGDQQLRNAIEVAHDRVLDLGEIAHYYAGLMAGLALMDLQRNGR